MTDFSANIRRLAALIPNGELMAATDPAAFFDTITDEIQRLRDQLAGRKQEVGGEADAPSVRPAIIPGYRDADRYWRTPRSGCCSSALVTRSPLSGNWVLVEDVAGVTGEIRCASCNSICEKARE